MGLDEISGSECMKWEESQGLNFGALPTSKRLGEKEEPGKAKKEQPVREVENQKSWVSRMPVNCREESDQSCQALLICKVKAFKWPLDLNRGSHFWLCQVRFLWISGGGFGGTTEWVSEWMGGGEWEGVTVDTSPQGVLLRSLAKKQGRRW